MMLISLLLAAPNFKADPAVDGTKSETFIMVSLEKRIVLIGGTEYAGEMKKSIFSIMNYLLPEARTFYQCTVQQTLVKKAT